MGMLANVSKKLNFSDSDYDNFHQSENKHEKNHDAQAISKSLDKADNKAKAAE